MWGATVGSLGAGSVRGRVGGAPERVKQRKVRMLAYGSNKHDDVS